MANDDMGMGHALKDPNGKSITNETFKILAEKAKKTPEEIKNAALAQLQGESKAKVILNQMMKEAADSQGMSIKESEEETIKLLKKELHKN
jgi:hypothetical protein